MSHLRIVGSEPKKKNPPKKYKRRNGLMLPEEDRKRGVQALKNLRDAFGTWTCLADAMDVALVSLKDAVRTGELSIAMLFAASRASGLTIEDLLSAPVPADRCKACGQVKRYAKALEARAV